MLAVCAIFKDEVAYIEEWIDFHERQGVDRFYLYDNESSDGSRELVEDLAAAGHELEVRTICGGQKQFTAYADCLDRQSDDADWIAFLDLDEFLYSSEQLLPEALSQFRSFPGVVANWAIYGTSGHESRPESGVIDSYIRRAPTSYSPTKHVKSIVQPRRTKPWPRYDAHHFIYYDGYAVNVRGQVVNGPFSEPPTYDVLRVNHYWSKSVEECHERCAKVRVDVPEARGSLEMFLDPVTNEVVDESAIAARDNRPIQVRS